MHDYRQPPDAERTMETSRIMRFTPSEVFESFRDPNLLSRWWGPNGFSNRFLKFDFRDGGEWHFIMVGPNGREYENESRFASVEDPGLVVIEHISLPKYVLVVLIEASDEGTRIIWRQTFENKKTRDNVANIVGDANEQNLDRMEGVLAELED
ncbi:MAG: SRPBCC domain-containing protein [Pyrinomonadaceae bacterium]